MSSARRRAPTATPLPAHVNDTEYLDERPEPFWQPGGVTAAAWDGRVPTTFSLLARHA